VIVTTGTTAFSTVVAQRRYSVCMARGGFKQHSWQAATAQPHSGFGFEYAYVPSAAAMSLGDSAPRGATVLLLHGTGGDEHDLLPLARTLMPGCAVLSPRGQVQEHGMPRYFRRFSPGVFDIDDALARGGQLAAFVRAAIAHHVLPARVVAIGYSNGANVAHTVMATVPGVIALGVLLRPMLIASEAQLAKAAAAPKSSVDDPAAAILLSGTSDPTVPPGQAEKLATLLASRGVQAELKLVLGGHELTQQDVREALRWLDAHGLAKPSP